MRDEIQIVASCLSLDERVPADVLAVTGASIATLLGEIPFYGPMAAVRVGLIGDDFILNPSYREIEKGSRYSCSWFTRWHCNDRGGS